MWSRLIGSRTVEVGLTKCTPDCKDILLELVFLRLGGFDDLIVVDGAVPYLVDPLILLARSVSVTLSGLALASDRAETTISF